MDTSILHALNGYLFHHDYVEDTALAYSNASQFLFLMLVLGLAVLAYGRDAVAVRRAAVAAALSAALAVIVAQLISHVVDRARPFVTDPQGVHLFDHHVADPGFPSDHATAAFAIAVAITLRSPRWGVPLLAAAMLLCAARVGLGVHYPSDVLGGALLGTMCAVVLWIPPVVHGVDHFADTIGRWIERARRAVMPEASA